MVRVRVREVEHRITPAARRGERGEDRGQPGGDGCSVEEGIDLLAFNAWFGAYIAGNTEGADIAERRFRPEFAVAFNAWIATNPFNDVDAPPGPTYMPEYKQPELDQANALDQKADDLAAKGAESAVHADRYVRITVFLATVLFLVGISGHFKLRAGPLRAHHHRSRDPVRLGRAARHLALATLTPCLRGTSRDRPAVAASPRRRRALPSRPRR